MAPLVRFCCCGCDLRVGTILIGIFCLLSSVYSMYVEFQRAHDIKESHDETLKDYIGFAYAGGVVATINVIMNTVLLGAAQSRKRGPILCWLIWEIVLLVVGVGLTVFTIVLSGFTVMAVGAIIGWVIQIYFLIVVSSFAQELLEEQQRNQDPRPTNPVVMGNFSKDPSPPYEQLDNVV